MRNWLLYIFAFLTVVLLSIVGAAMFLFSESGNRYIASFIQEKIDEKSDIKVTLSEFRLSPKTIGAKLTTDDGSFIEAGGTYSILKKSFDGEYKVNVIELESFSELIGHKLRGQFITAGSLKASVDKSDIEGVLDAFGGHIEYAANIEDNFPVKVILKSTPLDIGKLLYFANQPPIASGTLSLNADILPKSDGLPYGNADIVIENGVIYKNALAKAYNTDIPKDLPFKGAIKSDIAGNSVKTDGAIDSELANLIINNLIYDIQKSALSGAFELNVAAIELPNLNIYEPFYIKGNIKDNGKESLANITSNLLGGNTDAAIMLEEMKPKSVDVTSKSLSIDGILRLLKQERVAKGTIDLNSKLKFAKEGIKSGSADVYINDGMLFKNALAKAYETNIPKDLPFKGVINTTVDKDKTVTDAGIESELVNLVLNKFAYDLNDKSMDGAFNLKVAAIELPDINIYKPFEIDGKIKDNGKESLANITTNILDSDTKVDITLKEMNPASVNIDSKGITLESLSKFAKQQEYAEGELVINAKIEGLDKNDASGSVNISSENINIPVKTQKELMGFKDAKSDIQAKLTSKTEIAKNIANTNLVFSSPLAEIKSKKITYDLGKSELDSEIDLHLPDLKKIAFITGKELTGTMDVNNKIGMKGGEIDYKGYSKTLGGEVKIEFAKEALKIDATNILATELGKMLQLGDLLQGGTFALDADLDIPKNAPELMRIISGRSTFRGENFTLNGYNIDMMINNFKDTQSINLMDIGAFVVAGPLGIAATKGAGVGGTALGSAGGATLIQEMLVDLDIKSGVANAKDVAFATKTNLIAAKGDVRLWDYGLNNFWIAVMDKYGCTEFKQEVGGTLDNPKIKATQASFEVVKNVVKSVGSLFGDTIGKVVDTVAGSEGERKCEKFYQGSVKYPK